MRAERGAVSVLALAVAVLLVLATLVAVQVTLVVRARHQVAAAADLAALAASRASVSGEDGCGAARAVAHRNGADLADCRMDLDVATVVARGRVHGLWGGGWTVRSKARAAPEWYRPVGRP